MKSGGRNRRDQLGARSYPAPSGITPRLFVVQINKRVDIFRIQNRGVVPQPTDNSRYQLDYLTLRRRLYRRTEAHRLKTVGLNQAEGTKSARP